MSAPDMQEALFLLVTLAVVGVVLVGRWR